MLSSRPRLSTTERLRFFKLHGGICHICGEAIDGTRQRWDIDHVTARGLKAEGFAAEANTDGNMRPAHARPCHAAKTLLDVDAITKANRQKAKHVGAFRSSRPMPGGRFDALKKRMDGCVVRRDGSDARG